LIANPHHHLSIDTLSSFNFYFINFISPNYKSFFAAKSVWPPYDANTVYADYLLPFVAYPYPNPVPVPINAFGDP